MRRRKGCCKKQIRIHVVRCAATRTYGVSLVSTNSTRYKLSLFAAGIVRTGASCKSAMGNAAPQAIMPTAGLGYVTAIAESSVQANTGGRAGKQFLVPLSNTNENTLLKIVSIKSEKALVFSNRSPKPTSKRSDLHRRRRILVLSYVYTRSCFSR